MPAQNIQGILYTVVLHTVLTLMIFAVTTSLHIAVCFLKLDNHYLILQKNHYHYLTFF